MSVSIVIPYRYRSPQRDRAFNFVFSRLYEQWPGFEISVADSEDEDFSRSKAINQAVKQSHGDFLVICDADTICNTEPLTAALRYAQEHNTWAYPYGIYYNLTENDTQRILAGSPTQQLSQPIVYEHALDYVVSGMFVIPRWAFEAAGGFNPDFIGWGYEDDAFHHVVRKVLGPAHRVDGFISHLYHDAPESERFGQPNIERNRRICNHIKNT